MGCWIAAAFCYWQRQRVRRIAGSYTETATAGWLAHTSCAGVHNGRLYLTPQQLAAAAADLHRLPTSRLVYVGTVYLQHTAHVYCCVAVCTLILYWFTHAGKLGQRLHIAEAVSALMLQK